MIFFQGSVVKMDHVKYSPDVLKKNKVFDIFKNKRKVF